MRVLLLGGTGNLGLRCIPAILAHSHTLTVYVRNIPKLHSLVSPALIAQISAVVEGDAIDVEGLKKAIRDHDIEGIINIAGNQVLPWNEYVLPKIAKAISDAAIAVGKERGGKPLRIWVCGGIADMEIPGTGRTLMDYVGLEKPFAQHTATRLTMSAIPTSDLRWSLLCVCWMQPVASEQGLFTAWEKPKPHNLLVEDTVMLGYQHSWVESIPFIGRFLWFVGSQIWRYGTPYQQVADMLAEDLEIGEDRWVGKRIGYIQKEKIKDV